MVSRGRKGSSFTGNEVGSGCSKRGGAASPSNLLCHPTGLVEDFFLVVSCVSTVGVRDFLQRSLLGIKSRPHQGIVNDPKQKPLINAAAE
ncbi:hypothetical protein CEXT_124681 [Caerostris extrusa]|uniref:Uncharacterized protein n=1 Tax=Caerostris extrusa TaxID=172846 RepID=A0AAV4X5M8_CAEEX|nr:hypothetical protein CEXT_124681 [Caerostris extrusa]